MDVTGVQSYQPVSAPPPPPTPTVAVDTQVSMPVQSPQPVQESAVAGENSLVPEMLQRAVVEINSSLAAHSRHLSVSMHEATGRHVVTVYNSDTSEVVREIPPARVLDAHANMLEMAGLFVNTRG